MKETEVAPEASKAVSTPGMMLRTARKQQNKKQEEIAGQLHLSVRVIREIENDNYSKMAARIYVRGYLLAYAREIGVNAEEILKSFEAMKLPDNLDRKENIASQIIPKSGTVSFKKRHKVRWITAFISALMVFMVVMWWQEQKHQHHSNEAKQEPSLVAGNLNNSHTPVFISEPEDDSFGVSSSAVGTSSSAKAEDPVG